MSALRGDVVAEIRRRSGPGLALLVWIYLYITALLAVWLLVTSVATGWSPTVVTSGSMSPGLRVGDVILLDGPTSERLPQHTIVTFDEDGERVAHRIFSIETSGYITKGDANSTPDTSTVAFTDVTGVGRFVVPFVGLPVVWLTTGNTAAFAAWILSILGGIALVGTRRRNGVKLLSLRQQSSTSQRAIRSVRVVVGFLILTQFVIDPNRLDIGAGSAGRGVIVLVSLLILAGTNLVSTTVGRSTDEQTLARLAFGELLVDTLLVVCLTTATGTEGIGWILFALPIIESATRFRVSGALLHWMVLTAFSLVTRIMALDRQGTTVQEMFADLEQQVDQLSVLLLVVIPGAYLAEQLLNDAWTQRRATDDAVHQSELLQQVVDTTNSVSRLGADMLSDLTSAIIGLGFTSTDIISYNESRCETLASAGLRLPMAGKPASTLQIGDLVLRDAIVDGNDESEEERNALKAIGLNAVVRIDVRADERSRLCIRAGLRTVGPTAERSIDALRLLASHAAVALQNETLLGEMRFMHDRMRHQAQSDALTRLPNRARFLNELRDALEEDRVAVMFCDLNGFKPINDRMGHDAGDELLVAVANRLSRLTPAPNVAARFGGDEFTILLPGNPTEAEAEFLARSIATAIAEPFTIGRGAARITASVGVAFGDPGNNPDEVLRRADVAMYYAKSGDAPHIAHYNPDMDVNDQRRNRLALELREAMRNQQISMVYQPIVASVDGTELFGSEALIRWFHPDLGAIPPPDIIDLARNLGLTDELNRFVLDQSLALASACNLAHPDRPPTVVTANLSPGELELPSLVENVETALAQHDVAPEQLVLELSENLITPDEDQSGYVERLHRLTELGVRLLIDDFGEGRTSLGFLRSLPIAGVKIDRSLVVNSTESHADEAIVASIIGLAHDLGLFIVAEGIETLEQGELLKRMGADQLQGYLLHRPLPGNDFIALHAAQPFGHKMVTGRNEAR